MPPRVSRQATVTASSTNFILEAPQWQCQRCQRRGFASTPAKSTRLRRQMFSWLQGPGKVFKEHVPGSTNYISAYDRNGRPWPAGEKFEKDPLRDLRPFPVNSEFYSQSILSEELRNEIHRQVKVLGQPVRQVSVEFGVDLRRVGAVVRLVELEHRMRAEGKSLAIPYARAVHEMVPVTPYNPGQQVAHESINDLPVHAATDPQIFWPTSESRAFNRTDAGRVFSGAARLPDGDTTPKTEKPKRFEMIGKRGEERQILLPADARIPHPHLIEYHRDRMDRGLTQNRPLIQRRNRQRIESEIEEVRQQNEKRKEIEDRKTTRVETGRWNFLFKEVQVSREVTGTDGRGPHAPGHRYGVPSQERKRGQHKLPRSVPV